MPHFNLPELTKATVNIFSYRCNRLTKQKTAHQRMPRNNAEYSISTTISKAVTSAKRMNFRYSTSTVFKVRFCFNRLNFGLYTHHNLGFLQTETHIAYNAYDILKHDVLWIRLADKKKFIEI